jgi:LmbE family N-acetylglucosaminyl deacetylase
MRSTYPVTRVLVVMAHPDDADVRCGGTIARWAAEDKEIAYVVVTAGSRGGPTGSDIEDLAATRRAEQQEAAKVLGVGEVTFLDYDDNYVLPSLPLRRDISREIRRFRPEVVITHNPLRHYGQGNHPDHLAVGEATYAAMYPTAQNPLAFPELLDDGLEPWEVTWSLAIDAEQPDHFVDVTATIEIKVAALACHTSQYGPEYLSVVTTLAAQEAQLGAGCGYPGMQAAEAFKVRYEGHPRNLARDGFKVPG